MGGIFGGSLSCDGEADELDKAEGKFWGVNAGQGACATLSLVQAPHKPHFQRYPNYLRID